MAKTRCNLSAVQKEEIRRRYKAGEPVAGLVAEFGTVKSNVCRIVKYEGPFAYSSFKLTEEESQQAIALYLSGMNAKKVGLEFKVSEDPIYAILVREGIPLRVNPNYRLTADQRKEVVERYREGESVQELSKIFSVGESSIKRLLTKRGVKKRRNPIYHVTQKQKDTFCELYVQGKSSLEISEITGVTKPTVLRWLRLHGVEMREYVEAMAKHYISEEYLAKKNKTMLQTAQSIEYRKRISAQKQGIALAEWTGFSKDENQQARGCRDYRVWRMNVFKRDSFTCQRCGADKCYLNAHHIRRFADRVDLRNEVSNGITLCVPCHKNVNRREVDFEAEFDQIVASKSSTR